MIRDRIVFGTNSMKVREKLINEGAALTMDKVGQITQNFEYSKQQLSSMATSSTSRHEVHNVRRYQLHNTRDGNPRQEKTTQELGRPRRGKATQEQGKLKHKCIKLGHHTNSRTNVRQKGNDATDVKN